MVGMINAQLKSLIKDHIAGQTKANEEYSKAIEAENAVTKDLSSRIDQRFEETQSQMSLLVKQMSAMNASISKLVSRNEGVETKTT
ncbi:BgtAc-31465 [Blumeria graminis f. sp. tritici]|uniref:BgtAc-31465 n=2 Tax=Blumeria graminis f. sp. tritici TaxID=62690 RepID=A0A9X9MEM8_BLUGR|nr:hypothetical protein BGT96224_Ac31465 [Blumeria graminis f. sp. tritici 96224]VDB83540.1 BgtAc-31465 [Blumeria graminis f. sp. tritici]